MGDGVSSRRLLVEFREYFSPALVASGVELQVPRLRYPGFPVEVGGVGELMRLALTESRTRGRW